MTGSGIYTIRAVKGEPKAMHLIGFSHHYAKMHGQTYGTLLSVRSTKPRGCRPDDYGIQYDTCYRELEDVPFVLRGGGQYPNQIFKVKRYHPLKAEDFDKPLLQLVFIGGEHQIPFTTYREFPNNYVPRYLDTWTYDINVPYTDLIGKMFAFKFKGEPLPKRLASKISKNHIEIFD